MSETRVRGYRTHRYDGIQIEGEELMAVEVGINKDGDLKWREQCSGCRYRKCSKQVKRDNVDE